MKFEVMATPTIGLQDYRVPRWMESEPGIKVLNRSEDGKKVIIEAGILKIPNLKLKLGDPWLVNQILED